MLALWLALAFLAGGIVGGCAAACGVAWVMRGAAAELLTQTATPERLDELARELKQRMTRERRTARSPF